MLQRVPAKLLVDIELKEDYYKADFDLSERYDKVSTELERLALLGIGAYGYMLTALKDNHASVYTQVFVAYRWLFLLPAAGLVAFAVAAGCALSCGYLNSRCLKLQIDILRLLQRLESVGRWTEEEQASNRLLLQAEREQQAALLRRGRHLAYVATAGLIWGASATAITFILVLFLKVGLPST